MRLGLAGDVMLGRLVDRYVLADPAVDPGWVWGDTLDLWRRVDLRLVNLECVIATGGSPWVPKVFHFRARPRALDALRAAGIHCVSLANNHVLDFGYDALRECLALLRGGSIRYAGAGETLQEAMAPALMVAGGRTVAVVALTDNEPDWEAGPDRPGVFYVAGDDRGLRPPYRERVRRALERARREAGFVIVSGHVGPNWGPPTPAMRALARQLVDLGADLYWGHSNHTVQGIEWYRGRPLLYSTGDFIDDYAVDPEERNDLSCFFEVLTDGARAAQIRLHPVRIATFRATRARGEDVTWLHRWLRARMEECGTRIFFDGDVGVVERPDSN
ncbi:MAG: CapA family protein [Armatimonadota bacterium]|nr:CapA family protein [Armatimonadota bacterium]MDR7402182.1 CapA family protein [Armatimonadota bacterium]MDR7404632.1 CapA family protein [Armatimonadota bacterium]MDR7436939.1 CapA family protein [Armatimonadota bacterium]MDR7472287.1 CapA family protein [Armatimonadota bacterium]